MRGDIVADDGTYGSDTEYAAVSVTVGTGIESAWLTGTGDLNLTGSSGSTTLRSSWQ